MIKILFKTILTVFIFCFITDCKKYAEQGNSFKYKEKLRGLWKVKSVIVNGVDILPFYNDSLITSTVDDIRVGIEPDYKPCPTCSKSSSYYEVYTSVIVRNTGQSQFNILSRLKSDLIKKRTIKFYGANLKGKTAIWFMSNPNFEIVILENNKLKIKNNTHEIIFEKTN
ncbi:MAG: hypothetical protein ACK5QC_00550 [Bacteroidota bacterium]|jgi:hypothetical protein